MERERERERVCSFAFAHLSVFPVVQIDDTWRVGHTER